MPPYSVHQHPNRKIPRLKAGCHTFARSFLHFARCVKRETSFEVLWESPHPRKPRRKDDSQRSITTKNDNAYPYLIPTLIPVLIPCLIPVLIPVLNLFANVDLTASFCMIQNGSYSKHRTRILPNIGEVLFRLFAQKSVNIIVIWYSENFRFFVIISSLLHITYTTPKKRKKKVGGK